MFDSRPSNKFMSPQKTQRMQRHSTRALFFIGGFGAASWAPLVPLLRERLAIGEDVLGMLLLCIGIGSLVTMPISGALASRFGCKRVLIPASILFAVMLLVLCNVPNIALAIPSLLIFGAVMGCIDVVVNIQAVIVEKAAGHPLMSGMHALWSVGGFVGAGLFGVWVGVLGLTPLMSTIIAALIILAMISRYGKYLLMTGGEKSGKLFAIPRGIVTFVGIIAFITFLSEGAIMDWSGVFLTTVRGFDISLAGVGFTMFSAAMLIMRLIGDKLSQSAGQKSVVLIGSILAFIGLMSIIFAESSLLIYFGFFMVGIGSANIVPIFFSMLGRQNVMPISTAVPAVTTLGYLGILAGPAAIGFLAHQTSLYAAFGFLAGLVALQFLISIYVFKNARTV